MANTKKKSDKTKSENKDNKKRTTKKKTSSRSSSGNGDLMSFLKSDKFKTIVGILLFVFTIFLFFAFLSFFSTHDQDANFFHPNLWQTINNASQGENPQNMLGIFGVYFSFFFITKVLGVASIGFLLLGFLYAYRLVFKRSLLPLLRTTVITFSVMILLSMMFAFLYDKANWLSGDMGYDFYAYLAAKVYKLGFVLLWMTAVVILLVIFGGLSWRDVKLKKNKKESKTTSEEEEDTEEEIAVEQIPVLPQKMSFFARLFTRRRNRFNRLSTSSCPTFADTIGEQDNMTLQRFDNLTKPKQSPPSTAPVNNFSVSNDFPEIQGEDILIDDEPFDESFDEPIGQPFAGGQLEDDTDDDDHPLHIDALPNDDLDPDEITPYNLMEPYDPFADLPDYRFPSIDLLENYSNTLRTREQKEIEIAANKMRIKETLENYKIQIQSISAVEGPTITLYEIVPDVGIRIAKIKNLEDDIALSLAALGIRIIAPMPGKGTIGIEVPNANPQIVPMKNVIQSEKFQNTEKMSLPIAIGKTISNEVFVFDLAKMPHVLMAGATGQGKSVGLNAMLTSLLYKRHPAELKFVLVDPKKVELTLYSKIERHYLAMLPDNDEAIITDTKKVVKTLNSLCLEMDNRYELLKMAQCRNIIEYNEKFKSRRLNPEHGHQFLPYIVLVFDEFADCIMTAGREVETPIARLAQLARAIGIHLIIATQRPSVNVITGLIKANFPARIAFRVSSKIDSRTILDTGGAENLIGKGDMLVSIGSTMTRVQCALVDTPEIERICDYIGEQRAYAHAKFLPEVEDEAGDTKQEVDDGEFDSMFGDCAREVVSKQQGSTSFLQRKFKLGYNRAGRIMDQLEREGIVGPAIGSKTREVIIRDFNHLEEILKDKGF